MKNTLIAGLFICLLSTISFALIPQFALSLDAKSASYTASINNFSGNTNIDPMYGIGVALRIPLKERLSLLFEGQYNTASSFTDRLGQKTDISLYPIEVSLQTNVSGLYFGGGINYTFWALSSGGTSFSENNGIGYQVYAGLDGLIFGNLELKYTYMTATVAAFGSNFNQASGALSIGTKIWIN